MPQKRRGQGGGVANPDCGSQVGLWLGVNGHLGKVSREVGTSVPVWFQHRGAGTKACGILDRHTLIDKQESVGTAELNVS